jgi:protein SCO1/2
MEGPMPQAQLNSAPRSAAFVVRIVAAALVVVVLGFAAFILTSPREGPRTALIGGAFALQDGDGKTVSDQTLKGRPFLVYFGYTHCPDVCPTELARVSDILGKMGDKPIPVLFITVDPERDPPKVMQDYVSSFNPAIVGLSGTPQAVEATEKTFRVFARKGQPQADGDYSMDHSSIVYLMDKNGAFVEAFNVERSPEEAAKELQKYL